MNILESDNIDIKKHIDILNKEYGNSYFILETYNIENGGEFFTKKHYIMSSVLKTDIKFSMNTEWTDGPSKAISDIVNDYILNDLAEIGSSMTQSERSFTQIDAASDKVYNGSSIAPINLEFRIYTNDNVGSVKLTSAKNWIKYLSVFSQPSIESKFGIKGVANMGVESLIGLVELGGDTLSNIGNALNNSDGLMDSIGEIIDKTSNTFVDLHNTDRFNSIHNASNRYGAKLWKLRILPGIFNDGIIGYISNWSVTYSKEFNTLMNEPFYYDFNITFEMDQVPNASYWGNILNI